MRTRMQLLQLVTSVVALSGVLAHAVPVHSSLNTEDKSYHDVQPRASGATPTINGEYSPWANTNWEQVADAELINAINIAKSPNNNVAKNVIMFLGDGMGIPTIASARIYNSESRNLDHENIYLSWEKFPHAAFSRTYNVDASTPDSAATGTAYLCGVKANIYTLGVTDKVLLGDCSAVANNKVRSIVKESVAAGKWTGLVTTTRITHASPAAGYANVADRNWEAYVSTSVPNYQDCEDIALQLITDPENQQIRVILGGGRRNFYPSNMTDPEYPTFTNKGYRRDGRDLIQEWINIHSSEAATFAKNKDEFDAVDTRTTDYLLGLFNPSHLDYEYDRINRSPVREPSLTDMVEKAIKILERGPNGYFLFVEGGRIDHSHHDSSAFRALNDTLAMSDAVQRAVDLTSDQDTMIVVTADHSHVFSFGGYSSFKPSIFGFTDGATATDKKPMLQLHYANGPGYTYHRMEGTVEVPRKNLTGDNVEDPYYKQDAGIPISSETHGGEDVGIYASGPMAHLFHGVHEQNYIARLMMHASCVGRSPGAHCSASPRSAPAAPAAKAAPAAEGVGTSPGNRQRVPLPKPPGKH